jgi:hypothetical protein
LPENGLKHWFLVLGFLHGVWNEFSDDVSGAVVDPERSSGNSPRTPCKNLKTKNKYSFHGGSLKSGLKDVFWFRIDFGQRNTASHATCCPRDAGWAECTGMYT